ncbi:magnesium transporter [Paenibacillus sp. FSL A5-0031]|uniref:magnesium transporter CorA family protein n=1 Tax=Paenibacillus sp. FSL A5-0031 TaxID=1920420 RepID=UPI00096C7883|nr:magnesium transporter CorA family protein [Paenibacillus sp. FSL A5-0031]OME86280.1 magnesium transporter [Paenibacillus sp. FSL A5-0031]
MLNIYITDEHGILKETDEITSGCWVNLVAPTEQEMNLVAAKAQIPLDFIKDPLDEEERSRIENDNSNVLIVVNLPLVSTDDKGIPMYDTIPLGMIIADDCFITVCLKDNPIFHVFAQNKIKQFYTYKKTRFSFQILYLIATSYLKYLKQIIKMTDEIEKKLHQSMKNKELFSLLNMEKSLVYFTTSLKSNNIVMQKMLKSKYMKMYEDDQELLEDVIVENQQAIEMSETHTTILSGMMDAFASVISNNLNIVMKFLTSITIILSLPTMVASFYGMNVKIPFQDYPHAFFIAMTISVILSSVTAVIFWKKRFF